MDDELFVIENLWMSSGGKEILKNISLAIHRREIFALVGPSGAGKTTLLRILNLFEKPDRGSLIFKGIPINGNRASEKNDIRRRMSMLFQKPAIFKTSVFDNIAYGLAVRKIERKTIIMKVNNALSLVGLEGKKDQNACTLSGGEAQRMAFARAIVFDPDILLLDEPTANLDPANVAKIEEIISRIRNEHGTTIVFATHNIPQVKRIADRIGILLNGELIEVGCKDDILSNPKESRSEAFINGKMIY